MNPTAADDPMDDLDQAIMDEVAELYRTVDPVPGDLVDRIRFAVSFGDLDAELMRLVEQTVYAGVRGAEHSKIFTFSSTLVTLTIRAVGLTDDTVRVDGWLAPPAAHRVSVRFGADRVERTADEDGRFVVEQMPAGVAQLIVRMVNETRPTRNVLATPAVVL
ncbi:hypothetical protein SAMN05421812_108301 [Asanoa hainanensis]|uniref:Carboxypeptidase regulatory-like domain-containing protein n=1 Tax=Asanoa hainanensis TaxID=560556 RepID=A0A239NFM7_9ACTN|nr:hypothetical protein [Asanoa hainanensis]SNT53767.1 hypothetical protein SAMN05421812_108301 [Asanoa hainanensis]